MNTLRDIFISWVVTLANLSWIFCRNKIARKVLLTANDDHQFFESRRELMHANVIHATFNTKCPWSYCQRSHRNVYIPACCSCLVATSYESGSNRMCDLHSLHLNPGPTSGIACRLMPHGGASRFIQISTLGLKKCEQMPHPKRQSNNYGNA